MFLSGVFLSGLCSIVFGFLVNAPDGVPFISLCFVIQSFGAIGCASSMTSSFTILAHTFPKNITTALGVLELFSGLGFLLGPPLGGFLYALGGYEVPFIVVGFLVLLTVPVNMIILLSVQGKSSFSYHLLLVTYQALRSDKSLHH
ncbi:MFS-type transporter SLC18B1-like [Protopterus annectens]|uniref:MFS-type transporter SLC18B1-like n=1 Tax=Protopterus annectens TaxID=7888 RepID=UPI001CF96864|nr:MFS-type transporter SLC18B1-like [Protopterus annectens]